MNAANTFFRACRSQTLALSKPRASHSSPSFAQRCTRHSQQRQQQQCRRFTSAHAARAQPVHDLQSDAVTSQPGEKLPHTILSRAETDPATSSTSMMISTPPQTSQDAQFLQTTFQLTGHVSRVSTMSKTVRVSRNVQVWDRFLRKHYTRAQHDLVHDPQSILVEGDVIKYGLFPPSVAEKRREQGRLGGQGVGVDEHGRKIVGVFGDRVGVRRGVRWVVRDVVTPFGTSVEERLEKKKVAAEVAGAEAAAAAAAALAIDGSKESGRRRTNANRRGEAGRLRKKERAVN